MADVNEDLTPNQVRLGQAFWFGAVLPLQRIIPGIPGKRLCLRSAMGNCFIPGIFFILESNPDAGTVLNVPIIGVSADLTAPPSKIQSFQRIWDPGWVTLPGSSFVVGWTPFAGPLPDDQFAHILLNGYLILGEQD